MATADELLSTLDTDKTLIIDKDLRIITIPSSVKNLGVESDDDVLRLKFSMPRMYGDVDLSDFSIYINYMNAKNTGDVYVVDDKTIADDTITFSWLVGRVALAYKGSVRFIVCMKKHDDDSNVIQEYNTTIASLPVLEGLETGETVIQQNPDIIEMLLTSSEPLVGTTRNITPSQVLAAIKAGRDIALQYTDSYYGTFVFSAFNANERLGIVVSNSILPQMDGLTGTLLGFVEDDTWIFKVTNTATKDDVGTAVNEALAAAKASGEFDGADGITPTIGDNGNWYLGDTDTNKPSGGANGKSAYSYAQDGGYIGTEAEFAAKLAAEKLPNPYPLTFTGAVSETYDGSSAKTIEIPSGGGGSAWHTIGTQKMDGVETAVSFDLNGETIIQIIVTANFNEALTATKATVSLTLENGTTVDFTSQTMNATAYSPKNIFTIFGNSKQCRQMIFSKAEGTVYNSVQGSFGVAYGYDYYSEHMVEDKIATGITITFDKAPSNATVVKVEGM